MINFNQLSFKLEIYLNPRFKKNKKYSFGLLKSRDCNITEIAKGTKLKLTRHAEGDV